MLITLVLFIVVMGFSLGPRKVLSWPESFLRDTTGFVQKMFYKPAGYVAGLFEDIGNLKDLAKENEELKILAAQYARDKATYNFIESQYKLLQKQLHFTAAQKAQYDYEYWTVQVVGESTEPNNSSIVIDRGSNEGVEVNMSVISDKGLVGIVSRVSKFTATVKLMTMMDPNDPNSQPPIAATTIDKEGKSFGMVESYDLKTGRLLMKRIPPGDPIKEKDTIISSGSGGLYPQGLIIGTVESVDIGEYGLTSTAVIKPSADFQDWKLLTVVATQQESEE